MLKIKYLNIGSIESGVGGAGWLVVKIKYLNLSAIGLGNRHQVCSSHRPRIIMCVTNI